MGFFSELKEGVVERLSPVPSPAFYSSSPFLTSLSSLANKAKEAYILKAQAIYRKLGLSGGRPMTDSELAELEEEVAKDIERACAGNKALEEESKRLLHLDLKAAHKQDKEFHRSRSLSNALSRFGEGLFDFAGGVLPVLVGIGVAVAVIAGLSVIRRI